MQRLALRLSMGYAAVVANQRFGRRISQRWRLPLGGLLAAVLLHACLIYNEDLLLEVDGSCDDVSDCPGVDSTCSARGCTDGACGTLLANAATACTDGGGQVCDGAGNCVQCVDETQCMQGQSCSIDNVCQDGLAENGAGCANPEICQSMFCVDDRCCENACSGDCSSCSLTGSEGVCTSVPEGADPESECGNDVCNGLGACRCNDGMTNGSETDIDCGGGVCGGCALARTCGSGSDCLSGYCPSGTCLQSPACGNNQPDPNEDCDDGNTEPYDGCSGECLDPTSHLIISEVVVTPTDAEFVEIYNPTNVTVDLSDVYLADFSTYYLVTNATANPGASDFYAKFPNGSSIVAGGFVTVSMQSATEFQAAHAVLPDFDLDANDGGAPEMIGDYTGSTGLTNGGEVLVLFRWDGNTDLVTDIDYVGWGSPSVTTASVDKSGQVVLISTYLNETPINVQSYASAPGNGSSIHRCDTAESTEIKTGSNGTSGHDEMSEDLAVAFTPETMPSRGGPPTLGLCP
jgi:hypothetical protein